MKPRKRVTKRAKARRNATKIEASAGSRRRPRYLPERWPPAYFEKWDAAREIFPRQAVYSFSIRQKYFLRSEVCDQNREKGGNQVIDLQ
jgi:hypothetical protein